MEKKNRMMAIRYALMAAVFYALNRPLSKVLLRHIAPTFMASLLYLRGRTWSWSDFSAYQK